VRPQTRQRLADAAGGELLLGAGGGPIGAVFTDTRRPVPGGLFVALRGPTFDGHDFLGAALAGGAAGCVVSAPERVPAGAPAGVLVIAVADTLAALQGLASHARRELAAQVVAVTGSVGKTTVKDMLAAALAPFGKVGRTLGNFNNEIGLPLSLLALDGDERAVVLELGMSAAGEIAALTELARPDVGLVTTAAAAHLAFFESVDAIADAKAELYERLPPGARAVVNADDPRMLARARALRPDGLVTYGAQAADADLRVIAVRQTRDGLSARIAAPPGAGAEEVGVRLRALGRHNAVNAAGALAAVHALGLDVAAAAAALSTGFVPSKHRLAVVPAARGLTVLDDAYNANPVSARAALDTLAEVAADAPSRGAVLGSMLELGPSADALHRELGAAAAAARVDVLFATGPHAGALAAGAREAGVAKVYTADDALALSEVIAAFAGPDRWLLLKGSRGERLERLLDVLGAAMRQGY
jgi:UDP-N-acetylmuramoyl-tripeptide--D-alanyl-D-alanine ligase